MAQWPYGSGAMQGNITGNVMYEAQQLQRIRRFAMPDRPAVEERKT
jgi:hypothetical protein